MKYVSNKRGSRRKLSWFQQHPSAYLLHFLICHVLNDTFFFLKFFLRFLFPFPLPLFASYFKHFKLSRYCNFPVFFFFFVEECYKCTGKKIALVRWPILQEKLQTLRFLLRQMHERNNTTKWWDYKTLVGNEKSERKKWSEEM